MKYLPPVIKENAHDKNVYLAIHNGTQASPFDSSKLSPFQAKSCCLLLKALV